MINTYKMKEATGKEEAIISILDVLKEKPLFLNKCTGYKVAILSSLKTTRSRKIYISEMSWDQIRDLFIELKTAYYNQLDLTNKI
jgi:hypothetical protein|tara:strand:- start:7199 stop:7453 length:255 start_codon:yes stop_codon:yes gene_type:complete